jgi:hypothetical protein
MREVMIACAIMHRMIIKSEWENLVIDTKLYHQEGPGADADHEVLTAFAAIMASLQEITKILITNSRRFCGVFIDA